MKRWLKEDIYRIGIQSYKTMYSEYLESIATGSRAIQYRRRGGVTFFNVNEKNDDAVACLYREANMRRK